MSVWVGRDTKVVVQGMSGSTGAFHARGAVEYGTRVVAGVSPTKAGETLEGIPLFASVAEAVRKTKANTSIIYVPAAGPSTKDAWVVGPNASHIGDEKVPNPGQDAFLASELPWPSDHKGVLVALSLPAQ